MSQHDESGEHQVRLSRRQFMRRAGLFSAGLAALPILASCGGGTPTATTAATGGGTTVPSGGGAASPAAGGAPAQLKGAKLSLLMGSGFVKDADEKVKDLAAQWSKEVGADLSVEIVNSNDLQSRVASSVQSNSGPDIITYQNNWPYLYEGSFADVSDIASKLADQYGGYYDILVAQSKVNGTWRGVPMNVTPNAIHYRTDLYKQAGYDSYPTTFDDWLTAGKKVKQTTSLPYGAAAGHSYGDPKIMWYGVLWAFGGKEVDQNGKTVLINSPETQKALEWALDFWKGACDPDGISWDDSTNNTYYLAQRISATMNGSSIYLKAKAEQPDLADKTGIYAYPKGPQGNGIINNTNGNAVTTWSKNQNAAKEFVSWLMQKDHYTTWLEAGKGYNVGALHAYDNSPIWTQDPKMKGFFNAAQDSRWVGWPAPPSRATSESDSKFVIVDMFARVFQGTAPKDSMAQAEQALKDIYK